MGSFRDGIVHHCFWYQCLDGQSNRKEENGSVQYRGVRQAKSLADIQDHSIQQTGGTWKARWRLRTSG